MAQPPAGVRGGSLGPDVFELAFSLMWDLNGAKSPKSAPLLWASFLPLTPRTLHTLFGIYYELFSVCLELFSAYFVRFRRKNELFSKKPRNIQQLLRKVL